MSLCQPPLVVHRSPPLHGSLPVPCAKNSVLPLLAAALLCDGPVRLRRVPALSDVQAACGLLESLGRAPVWQDGDLLLTPGALQTSRLAAAWMGQMRSGVFFLAPVLARTGAVEFGSPGGCDLGSRPVDIHLEGLVRMGAQCSVREGVTLLRAPKGLHGCYFALRLPSVGATETMLMAAAVADGDTRLENVALEPEVLDLVRFLNACGAHICRLPGRRFAVRGVPKLGGVDYTAAADRIWCATLLCATAGCGGRVEMTGIDPLTLAGLPQLLRRAGCRVETAKESVLLQAPARLLGVGRVNTAPFPGFATDMAPLLAAALLRAAGPTRVCDRVFTHRFACARGFAALGAPVSVQDNCLTLPGPTPAPPLQGTTLYAQDLRGGAALLSAALQAEGRSTLYGMEYVRRGYEDLPAALAALGAPLE